MKVRLKCFIASKEHGDICQDSLAVDLQHWRFAVADGVTNSNHSEILSRLLSNSFIESETPVSDWLAEFNESILSAISLRWKEEEEKTFSQLTGREQLKAKIQRNYFPTGASTFAGFEVDNDQRQVSYLILGDSTLFVIGKDDSYFAVNSKAESNKKGDLLSFDNNPGTIDANGIINGDWITGCHQLKEGYIALMTDGCAKWFQASFSDDESILDQLWDLSDNEAFVSFVDRVWKQNPQYEDDWAVVLLKIENDKLELVYFPKDQQQASLINSSASEDSIAIVDGQGNDGEQTPQIEDDNAVSATEEKPELADVSTETESQIVKATLFSDDLLADQKDESQSMVTIEDSKHTESGDEDDTQQAEDTSIEELVMENPISSNQNEGVDSYDDSEQLPQIEDDNSRSATEEKPELADVSTETKSQIDTATLFSDDLLADRNEDSQSMVTVEESKYTESGEEADTQQAQDTSVEVSVMDNPISSNQNEGVDTYDNTEQVNNTNNE